MVAKIPLKLALILIGFLLIGTGIFFVRGAPNETTGYVGTWETKTDSQAGVEIKVTPQKLGVKEKENVFSIVLDTHAGSLDFDFVQIISLKDNLGNEYRPTAWSGGQGGHHLLGEISFPRLNPKAPKATLVITGVGGVTRTFEWEI